MYFFLYLFLFYKNIFDPVFLHCKAKYKMYSLQLFFTCWSDIFPNPPLSINIRNNGQIFFTNFNWRINSAHANQENSYFKSVRRSSKYKIFFFLFQISILTDKIPITYTAGNKFNPLQTHIRLLGFFFFFKKKKNFLHVFDEICNVQRFSKISRWIGESDL